MAIFAIIDNNEIINVIEAKTIKDAQKVTDFEVIESDGVFGIGWIFNGEKFTPKPKAIEEEPSDV